jgi:hypothetical protein
MRLLISLVPIVLLLCSCDQNMEVVRNGEMLANSPKPTSNPDARPLAGASGGGSGMMDVPPFVKAYFMHMFVEALYSKPQNKHPNPNWESPLLDPVNGRVWCTDCHVSNQIDFEKIPKQRTPMVDPFEQDKQFMAGLMKKWVARLNSDEFGAKQKLKKEVNCLTCHETNPEEQ